MLTRTNYSRLLVALPLMLFIGFSNSAGFTQEPSPVPNLKSKSAATVPEAKRAANQTLAAAGSRRDEPVAILRAQLERMREYHLTLISTVYWTLGIVGTLTLTLLAFASFVNFRLSVRERDAIRQDLLGQINQRLAEISRNLDTTASELRRDLTGSISDSMKQNESSTVEVLDELKDSVKEELSKIDDVIETKVRPIVSDVERVKEGVHDVELEILELEAFRWESAGVKANVLSTWIEYTMKAASKEDSMYNWRVERGLKFIVELMDGGTMPSAENLTTLDKLFNTLGDKFGLVVEKIREMAKGISGKTA